MTIVGNGNDDDDNDNNTTNNTNIIIIIIIIVIVIIVHSTRGSEEARPCTWRPRSSSGVPQLRGARKDT